MVAGALCLLAGHVVGGVLIEVEGLSTGWVTPALLLVGAGMGLCLGPVVSVVLGTVEPAAAGALSGVLSTTQQVGNAIGVALVGVVFYGALDRGADTAYGESAVLLALLLGGTALAARRLPR
ncbi:hypothetical protein BH11ACT8_BH11ACT8_27280 [soil metagenome]